MTEPLSYEQARAELADVVRTLEAGGVSLEESLALWERGERLAEMCERWLDGARARLAAAEPATGSDPAGATGSDTAARTHMATPDRPETTPDPPAKTRPAG